MPKEKCETTTDEPTSHKELRQQISECSNKQINEIYIME